MDLEALEEEIKKYAKEKGIKIIDSEFNGNSKGNIFDIERYQEIIDFASEREKPTFFSKILFEEDYFEKDEEEISDKEKWESFKAKYKQEIGKIIQLTLLVPYEGSVLQFNEIAHWYSDFSEEERELFGEDDSLGRIREEDLCPECKKNRKMLTKDYCLECYNKKIVDAEKIERGYAETLSKDEVFLGCKNDMERKLYIEEKYPEMLKTEFVYKNRLISTARALAKKK